jgi:hypothetical protein
MTDTKMLYNKRASGANPWFNGTPRGESPMAIKSDPANGTAGGYVRPEEIRSNLVKQALPNK